MTPNVLCPGCRSNQISPKREESTGAPVQTGLYCRTCGYAWNPELQDAPRETVLRPQYQIPENRWRKWFYAAYQRGDIQEAEQILSRERAHILEAKGVDGAYKAMKRADFVDELIKYATWFALAYTLYKLLSCAS